MNISVCQAKLPPATAIVADRENTVITTSWRSARGLHIVTMQLPTQQVLDEDRSFENALLDFLLLVEMEMANEEMTEAAE